MNRIFLLNQLCSNIPVDKKTTTKNTDKSSGNSQKMRYSKYVNQNSRNYYKITETEIITLTVLSVTPKSATITYTYNTKPGYVNMIVTNIQDVLDTHAFVVYDIPFTITGLSPNSYYTINTNIVFVSGNSYPKTFENAIKTLLEGPPLEPITITSPQYNSAILNFGLPIGNITSVNLTVLKNQDTSQRLFFPNIISPFLISGLDPDITYDISLSSFYDSTQNSYSILYKPALFKTFFENYPVLISATNIENTAVTITFSFTGTPSSNILILTNANNVYDTSFSKINITGDSRITFTGLHIDTSYNLEITSVYNASGHIYPILFTNVFHTLNESPVYTPRVTVILGDRITLTFIPASGNVLNYVVNLIDTNGNTVSKTYPTYPDSVTFYDLTNSTNYTLTITSNYSDNSYTYTYPNYILTLTEGPVKQIAPTTITNRSVVISFSASPGSVSTYAYQYQGEINNVDHYSGEELTSTIFALMDLAINTPYTVMITTNYANGHSYSNTFLNLFTTLNEGPSSIFNININIHTNSIDITFINMYGYPSEFVFYAKPSSYGSDISGNYEGIANLTYTYTLTGLSIFTDYTISIVTYYNTTSYTTIYPEPITISPQ